jgi:hypothetical protein
MRTQTWRAGRDRPPLQRPDGYLGILNMKLKLDDEGHAILVDGKPVYVHDDGKEIPFDAARTVETISRLNREAQTHREAKETAEGTVGTLQQQLKVFEGLDPEASRKALQQLKDIGDGKLIEAGKLDEVRTAAKAEYDARLKTLQEEFGTKEGKLMADREALQGHLNNEIVGGSFARSKFIQEKLAIPMDLVQAAFGKNFKVEDGKLVALDAQGNKVFSRARPGELADFEEAIGQLVDQYPNRDHILKASGASGSGASGSKGGGGGGNDSKSMTRTAFDALSPLEQSKAARSGVAITDD